MSTSNTVIGGSLVLPNSQTTGVKVNQTDPQFGWA